MPVVLAPERLVNTITQGAQSPGDAAVIPGGRSVAAWIDESSGAGVAKVRLFGPDGQPTTGEITVGAAKEVAIVPLATGFVVVRINEIGGQQAEIVARRYDLVGEPLVGGEVVVNSVDFRNSPILGHRTEGLQVAALSDGGYAVGWTSSNFDSSGSTNTGVVYQVVGAGGGLEGRGGQTLASGKGVGGYDSQVAFAELPGGQVLATWRLEGFFQFGQQVVGGQMGQILDLAGQPVGPAFRLDPTPPADGGPAIDSTGGLSVAALPSGQVAFAWSAGGSAWVSLYSVAALGSGARTAPNQLTAAAGAGDPQLVVLEDGSLVAGYTAGGNVFADLINASGQSHASIPIGAVTAGTQDQLRLATDDGRVVAIWRDASGLGGPGTAGDPSGAGVKLEIQAFDLKLKGTAEADLLAGSSGADSIDAGASDDRLLGAAGADTLDGGVGGDILEGGAGNDLIIGGPNFDFVTYGGSPAGVVVNVRGFANDGHGTVDELRSVEGVYGSSGNDLLRGDFVSNLLDGAGGDDTVEGQSGSNYLDGGSGTDTLVLVGTTADYFVTDRTAQGATVSGPFGTDTVLRFERVQLDTGTLSWADFTAQAFNGLRYIASNPDLIAAYGADAEKGRQHWINTGQAEGRQLATFDPLRYAASNPDLLAQFGQDTQGLTRHFITTGFAAGRPAASFDPLQYGAAHADLLLAFGPSPADLTRHYAVSGAIEGREKTGFDPLLYGASNADLARVFGTDANALFQHWINSGVYEGRFATGFDGLFYAATNDDLARAFGTDAQGALLHYLTAGADEGRAIFGFNPYAYQISYPDLAGLDPAQVLNHWLTIGADEGRRGDELFGREQFGDTNQTLVPGDVSTSELKNFTTSGRFSADRDLFSAGALTPGQYVFRASGFDSGQGTLSDPRLEIYDLRGHLIAADEDGGPGRDAMVTLNVDAFTGYFLVVRSAPEAEGSYQLSVTRTSASLAASDEGWII